MGLGDSWGTREELLHPRDRHGQFMKKWKMAADQVSKLLDFLSRFNPKSFPNDAAAAQYAQNKAKPGRFGGGTEYPRLSADFHHANAALRAGEMDPATQRFVRMMDSSAVDAPDDLILTQTVPPEAFGLTPETMGLDQGGLEDITGTVFADLGYTAAEIGTPQTGAPGTIRITYAVPKGTKIIPRGKGNDDRAIFLDRDQEFTVSKVEPDGHGGFYVMAVATPKTAGETPKPANAEAPSVTPQAREANVAAGRQAARKRAGVTPDLTQQEQQQPLAPGGGVPAAPTAGETPQARKARRQQILGQQPGTPPQAPAAAPAPTPEVPGGAPAVPGGAPVDFRAAVKEAQLPSPSAGKRRAEWNNAYLGLATGKKHPDDALRELESDIAHNKGLLEDDKRTGTDSGPLPGDIVAQEALRDLIKEKYGLGQPEQKPAPEAPAAPKPEAPKVPAKKAAPKAAVPKKAGAGPQEGEPIPLEEGKPSFTRRRQALEKKAVPRKAAEPVSREGRVPVGESGHYTPVKKATGFPREAAPPVNREGRVQVGESGHYTPIKTSKPEKVAVAKATPSRTKAPTTKAAREEEQQQMDTLRETIAKLPEGAPTRVRSEKLLAQMEQDHQDDELVREWLGGSGVREPSLTEAERAHLGRVARDIREGKLSNAEAGKDLRSQGSEKLDKIARRVEGGEKLKAARKPKTEPIDELDTQTLPELKATAKAEGIKGYSKLNKDAIKKAIRDKRGGVATPEAPAATPEGPQTKADALAELDNPKTTMARMREIAASFQIEPRKSLKKDDLRKEISGRLNVTESGMPEPGSPDAIKAAKKAAPKAEVDARERQKQIDSIRGTADLTAELDELVANEAEPAVMRHRVTATAKRLGVPDPVRDQLLTAVDSGDPTVIRRAIADIHGHNREISAVGGHAGQLTRFDRTTHRAIGSPIQPGERVRVVRPGREATLPNGEKVQLSKAVVEAEPEAPKAPEPKPATPEDRVTRHLLDRIGTIDPKVRDDIVAKMKPADRELVRESVARAGGTPPPVTDAETQRIMDQLPALREALSQGSIEDLRASAKERGLKPPKGETREEVARDLFKQMLQQELDRRVGGKAAAPAKKAAPKPRPEGAYEGLDLKEIGKGLDLSLLPQGLRDRIQKDLDEGKLTPAAIGRELDQPNMPMGPLTSRAMLRGVSLGPAREGLKRAESLPPGRERDAAVADAQARIDEIERESESLRRQAEETAKLAARLKATRRKRAIAPKPEEPILTPKEEAKAAEVADLAGVPESKVQARIKAQKVAAAPASDHGQGVADLLKASTSREEDEALLKDRTKRELQDILKAQGHTVRPGATKADLTRDILDTAALSRGSKAIRGMIQESGMMSSRMTPAQIAHRITNYDFENPPSRAETGQEIAGLSKSDLVEVAKQLGIPSPSSKTKDVLHGEIVEAAVGRRIDSIATRGFTGVRPGAPTRPLSELRAFQPPSSTPATPKATAAERLRPLLLRPPKGTPGERASASKLGPGDRVTVAQNSEGLWVPTTRKTDSKSVTVTRVDRTLAGTRGQSKYIFHGIDDDGNDVEIAPVFGQNTFTRAPLREKSPLKSPAAKAAQAPEPTKAAAPSITGPLQRKRPEFDAGSGQKPLERPNADEPIHLARGQMSGTGNLHGDSELGQLWDDLYRDDRVPNSTLNRISELAQSLAYGDRPPDEILHELRRLASGANDPAVEARITEAADSIDAPAVKVPELPEGTPRVIREALQKLASIPTARKTGRVGTQHIDQSVLDRKMEVIEKIAAGEISPYDLRSTLGSHDLHEGADGAVQMWDIFDRLISDHGDELRKWAQAARKKASG